MGKSNKIQLHNGDCLEFMKTLEDNSIDLILTDPPYGMSYVSNRRKLKYNKIINDESLNWLNEFINIIFEKMKENSAGYIFCSFHNIDIFKLEIEKKFKIKNILIWEKNIHTAGDLKGSFANKTEFIIFFHKGRVKINGKRDCNILKYNKTLNKNHPTEKPVDLLKYMIEKFSNEKETILDPFMGSGSTGIACIETSRKFIGIEIDDNYFNIAKDRIENHK